MDQLIERLRAAGIEDMTLNEPMANHTTWKIGGPADLFLSIKRRAELSAALAIIHEHQVPWTMIGRGSNVLVGDLGIRGVVLQLESDFSSIQIDGTRVTAGAGYSLIKLSVLAAKHGLTGLEFAGGIPGTVGGAVYMNAGAHGSDISQVLLEAELLQPDGQIVTCSNQQLAFSYRHSCLQERPAIVLSATFALQVGDRKAIAADMASFKERRQRTQPWQQPCAGSVFRNPPGDYAARLIEQAGLKGSVIGGVQISEIHANFIVNRGTGTASDVLALIELVRNKVREQFEVDLRPEVLVIGDGI
jgi:UDP-N-acetylmuramate dehydrogenase